jgi:hypothetical protein
MNQYITDLDGNLLEVTDLNEAIFQVAMYMTYLHNVPTREQADFAIKRNIYWKDIYNKLNQLRIKQSLNA